MGRGPEFCDIVEFLKDTPGPLRQVEWLSARR